MLAVGLGESEMRRYLSGAYAKLDLAAVNSPNSVTISGDASEVTDLSDMLHSQGVFTRILQTGGNAYHSSHMHRLGLEYEVLLTRALEELNLGHEWVTRDPCIKRSWISSVQPETPMSTSTQDPLYWRKNLISTVQFSAAMTKMLLPGKDQVDFIVEIGPHSALKTPLMQIWAEQRGDDIGASFYHPTLMREQDDMQMLLQLCGTLFTMNHKVDLVDVNSEDHLAAGEHVHRHGQTSGCLPPYHFSYGPPLYQESRASKEIRLRTHARHDLLGSRQPGCPAKSPSWRNILRIKDVPWLEHHKVSQIPSDSKLTARWYG
jgi:acyl transferase domain-containing protein